MEGVYITSTDLTREQQRLLDKFIESQVDGESSPYTGGRHTLNREILHQRDPAILEQVEKLFVGPMRYREVLWGREIVRFPAQEVDIYLFSASLVRATPFYKQVKTS